MAKFPRYLMLGLLWIILVSCGSTDAPALNSAPPSPSQATSKVTPVGITPDLQRSPTPSETQIPANLPTREVARQMPPTHRPTVESITRPALGVDDWKKLPVIPEVSQRVLEIYQTGLEQGNNPKAFSKVGDCGSTPAWFLGDFDRGPDFYRLGDHAYLSAVIQEFQGSFSRTSLAARSGFNTSSLLSPLWSDRAFCQASESPLACEYRIHKPIIAFIMLGANDIWHPDEFEPQMRKILEFSIEAGVIPIISTKADNEEGEGRINDTIARLAWEYDIPILNYWLAVQALPDGGLQEDQVHLTWGRNFFDDPEAMTKAWPLRNLTALQALDAVWKKISNPD